jgi:predicted transcriptional regulator
MPRQIGSGLSRREREILEALYGKGSATAAQVHQALADPPSYSAVRTTLTILEDKGHVRHEVQGKRYVYLPTQPRQAAAKSALAGVLSTFFGGSIAGAVRTFLTEADVEVADEELAELSALVEAARRRQEDGQ